MNPASSPIRKRFLSLSLAFGIGSLHAVPTMLTNFPAGFYLSPTNGGKTIVDLGKYFHVDSNSNTNMVRVTTSVTSNSVPLGFTLELFPSNAPQTVANFLSYVNDGAYENMLIHRSVPGFVIQTGGYDYYGNPIATWTNNVPSEYSLSNMRGTVAMALVGTNANSATDQWFVNLVDNSSVLDNTNTAGNPPFTVFGQVVGNGMQTVNAIGSLPIYKQFSSPFNEIPVFSTNISNVASLTNLVHISRVATIPYFALSSDPDACPVNISYNASATNLEIIFNHLPTNNPTYGVYISLAVTDSNGFSPKYTNYTTNNIQITTNSYDGGNTGFFVVPSQLGSQFISFASIPEQSLSNNAVQTNNGLLTNYTSFLLNPFPSSSVNVPVYLKIKSGPIQVITNSNLKSDIPQGTEFKLTGPGKVTLEASTFGTYTNALVNYYYKPAKPISVTFTVKEKGQSIAPFNSIFPKVFGDPPFQIALPSSTSSLPVTVKVKSGPATLKKDRITITGAGTVILTANQSGNTTYAAAKEATTSFSISKANQTITFPQIQDHKVTDKPFNITLPTTSSKLPITTTITGAKLKGKLITLNGTGTVTITATQNGNSNYNAASKSVSFIVSP